MTGFSIASFNVQNLIGAGQEYYPFQIYTPDEFANKRAWMAGQILQMNPDIVGFQEIFEEAPLRSVMEVAGQTDTSYRDAALAFAPNLSDGGPGARRPGLAMLSRLGFESPPEILQDLREPLRTEFPEAGHYTLRRLSRPIQKARIRVGAQVITVFNCHLKSKLGEYDAPAADLTRYDPLGRAIGAMRSAVRRMAEACVLRCEIVSELDAGQPVIALGDFNDGLPAVSTQVIVGERPSRDYTARLRPDAKAAGDTYSQADSAAIKDRVEHLRLHSAEQLMGTSASSASRKEYQSIDQICLSRHFLPETSEALGAMRAFAEFSDHLTDAALNPRLVSDHRQIMAHLEVYD